MFENIKKICDICLELGLQGYDLIVYKDGKCVYRKFDGYSDIENKVPMNGKERYNIYSCSKPITATAALQLWEKGLFSLEDKLADYMPEFSRMTVKTDDGIKKAENPILIKHLFEMTAGFSYDVNSPSLKKCYEETNGKCPTREAMKYLAKEPLLFEPGDRWHYSLCHDVLAALVEVISGEKFEIYVKKNIFDKVGMKDTTFMLPESELSTIAEQYRFADGKHKNVGKNILDVYKSEFDNAVNDDLNIPLALGVVWNALRYPVKSKKIYDFVVATDEILGLDMEKEVELLSKDVDEEQIFSPEIMELVAQRTQAKKDKQYALADEIRAKLLDMGIVLTDTKDGVKVAYKQ